MKCDTCAFYTTYLRQQNNGYINIWYARSHCEADQDEDTCKLYLPRDDGDE